MYNFNSESNVLSAMLEWKREVVKRPLTDTEYYEILDTVSENMVHNEFFDTVEKNLLTAL
jgi:hypothetical protein